MSYYYISGTYFSENALLPGLVRGEFDEENFANKLFIELREIMQSNPNQIPSTWLIQKFHDISLDAYIHRFNLTNPLSNNTVSKKKSKNFSLFTFNLYLMKLN